MTVEYDETVTGVAALRDKVNECGFHCTGQIMPKHVCEPHPSMPVSRGAPMKLAGSRPLSAVARTMPEPHVHAPAGAPAAATPAVPISHDMAHDMGHGAGMDMQAVVRDMGDKASRIFFQFPYYQGGDLEAEPHLGRLGANTESVTFEK